MLGIVAGLAAVLVATLWLFGLPLGPSLTLLAEGAVGDKFGIARTLAKATPLLLTGLGIVVAWRAGMYNIGGEGQFVVGAIFGAAFAKAAWGLPGALLNPLVLLACAVGGAFYASIAAWLHVARGVQVVISTILLNFVALELLDWCVSGPLRRSGTTMPLTPQLPDAAMLRRFDSQTDLHSGVLYALLALAAVYSFLFFTKGGFRLRLVGANPAAARANRISVSRVQFGAMILSGALCGLAGGVEYTGMTGVVGNGSAQGWGFLAIPVALVGGLHPLGVLASSLYFGALFAGSDNLSRFTASGSTIVYVIQAAAVLGFIGFKGLSERRLLRRTEAEG